MRIILIIFVVVLLAAAALVYFTDPEGCAFVAGRVHDRVLDMFRPAPSPSAAADEPSSSTPTESSPSSATDTSTPTAAATPSSPAAETPPAKRAWEPPRGIPAQPNWTWTTAHGVYKNVRILKIEADCVTIIDDDGGALINIADLPEDIQQQLNYDPDAAKVAAAQRAQDDQASAQVLENERASAPGTFDEDMIDYPAALAAAKSSGRHVLLFFKGDWSQTSRWFNDSVVETDSFRAFSAKNFIFVKVEIPRFVGDMARNLNRQNAILVARFHVSKVPTLVVVNSDGSQVGTISVADETGSSDSVISQLQAFAAAK